MCSVQNHTDPEVLMAERRDLADRTRAAGIGAQSDRIANLARPSIRLETGGSAGMSKLGGRPDLPPGLDWPMRGPVHEAATHEFLEEAERAFLYRPAPLTFIAQIDLGHIARHVARIPSLPDTGMLFFFYDVLHQGWGFDPADREGFRVLWAETSAEDLVEASLPDEKLPEFPAVSLGAVYALSLVDTETMAFAALGADRETVSIYREWMYETHAETHKLGGWPDVQQNAMESECALVSNGIYCGDASGLQHPERQAILAEETDWTLLLQIASDDDADMMWGDVGLLYVWIRDRDLRARQFDRCWTILQCG